MLSNLTTFEFVLLFIAVYICVFAIVNRICKCFESCSINKAIAMICMSGRYASIPNALQSIQHLADSVSKYSKKTKEKKNNDSGTV